MAPPVPDVWIRDFTQNTPAHRIVEPVAEPDSGDTAVHCIACPPGVALGGQVVTRKVAAALPTLPCARCFPVPASRNSRVSTAAVSS